MRLKLLRGFRLKTLRTLPLLKEFLLKPAVWLNFLVSRLIFLAAASLTPLILQPSATKDDAIMIVQPRMIPWPSWTDWTASFYNALFNADSVLYESIVKNGYEIRAFSAERQANWAFFPLYPLMVKLVGASPWAGILISNLFSAAALLALYNVVERRSDSNTAERAVTFLCYFPTSFTLSAYRPEGLFLLLTVGSYALATYHKWLGASALAFLASLTRSTGVLLVIVLVYEYMYSINFDWRRITSQFLIIVGAPLLGIAAFSSYMWKLTGNPLAWAEIQAAWGSQFSFPWLLGPLLGYVFHPTLVGVWGCASCGWDLALLNWAGAVIALITCLYLFKDKEFALGTYAILAVAAPLSSGRTMAFNRYLVAIFPLYIIWAKKLRHPTLYQMILSILAGFLALYGAWIGLGLLAPTA